MSGNRKKNDLSPGGTMSNHVFTKRGLVIGSVLLLILMAAVAISCGGTSQADYEALQAEVDASQRAS